MFRRRRDSCYRDYRLDARLKASYSLPSMQLKTGGLRRLVRWARDCLVENIPGAKSTWEFIKTESRGVKQGWVLFTVIGLVIVVVTASVTHKIDHFATIPTADWRSQDPPIKQQTVRLAAQIREFIRDWNDSDDETVQRENGQVHDSIWPCSTCDERWPGSARCAIP